MARTRPTTTATKAVVSCQSLVISGKSKAPPAFANNWQLPTSNQYEHELLPRAAEKAAPGSRAVLRTAGWRIAGGCPARCPETGAIADGGTMADQARPRQLGRRPDQQAGDG